MNLLTIYDFGTRLLEKYPRLKRLHEQLSSIIVDKCKKKKLFHMKEQETSLLTGNDLKRVTAMMFCVAGVFFIFAIIKLLQFYLLEFVILLIPVCIFYAIGVNNIAEVKLSEGTKTPGEELAAVSDIQSVSVSQKPVVEEKKVDQKPPKTPFWRIYEWIERIVVWGWIYISFAYPESIQEYIKQYRVWDYLPHEQTKGGQSDKMGYLFWGVIILSLAFALLRGVLKILFFIFETLFPKRDIREL